MNTRMLTRLAAVSIGLSAMAGFLACTSTSDNPSPAPTTHDSGTSNQVDGSNPIGSDSGPVDDAGGVDSNLPDVGPCTSDAAHCNSCYTPQQDPMNGCSPTVVNCQPFDNSRVPTGAP